MNGEAVSVDIAQPLFSEQKMASPSTSTSVMRPNKENAAPPESSVPIASFKHDKANDQSTSDLTTPGYIKAIGGTVDEQVLGNHPHTMW